MAISRAVQVGVTFAALWGVVNVAAAEEASPRTLVGDRRQVKAIAATRAAYEILARRSEGKPPIRSDQRYDDRNVRRFEKWLETGMETNQLYLEREQNLRQIKQSLAQKPISEQKQHLFDIVTDKIVLDGGRSIVPIEAAMLALTELPVSSAELTSFVRRNRIAPTTPSECDGKSATHYHRLVLVLASTHVDKDAKAFLNEEAGSTALCVANEAKRALDWVEAEVKYPLRYRYVLLGSLDERHSADDD
ncbi:MAG: hypothetical protein HY897_15685 [Deltaproteobacteria bacterium]|nr:hypothetical protein [Deltaproteobacteria bacterium]